MVVYKDAFRVLLCNNHCVVSGRNKAQQGVTSVQCVSQYRYKIVPEGDTNINIGFSKNSY